MMPAAPAVDHVVVVGGGRWARQIVAVLYGLLPPQVPLTVYSPRGADAVAVWAAERGLARRLAVTGQWPDLAAPGRAAVVVANAARDHAEAARRALAGGAAVLVEKPLAVSLDEARDLQFHAAHCGVQLMAAHVLRFARYLDTYAGSLPPLAQVRAITLEWIDPVSEQRHGEAKQYDPAVPVYIDCLPHAVSVLQAVWGMLPEAAGPPVVQAGGARVTLPLSLAGRACRVTLQRNGAGRRRRVAVETEAGSVVLDFSQEPGIIRQDGQERGADPLWDTAPRPLGSLLAAFLAAAAGGPADPRLSLDTGLAACGIAEAVTPAYDAAMLAWLADRLRLADEPGNDLRYALAELLQCHGRLEGPELELRVRRLRRCFADAATRPGAAASADDLRRLAQGTG